MQPSLISLILDLWVGYEQALYLLQSSSLDSRHKRKNKFIIGSLFEEIDDQSKFVCSYRLLLLRNNNIIYILCVQHLVQIDLVAMT